MERQIKPGVDELRELGIELPKNAQRPILDVVGLNARNSRNWIALYYVIPADDKFELATERKIRVPKSKAKELYDKGVPATALLADRLSA